MSYRTPITEADLHAYADGQLQPARRDEVERYLAEHPEAAGRVAEYVRLNDALQRLYAPLLDAPVPPRLRRLPRRRQWARAAAAAGWLIMGGLLGWAAHPERPAPASVPITELVRPAAFAHYIYASEIQHPVEIPGEQESQLSAWLSRRLHTPLRAPDISARGYALVGGRLLPSTDRMAAQYMYQRADGQRITLYIRRGSWDARLEAFRYADHDGVKVLYWIDGELGYALAGQVDRDSLVELAEAIYEQVG